MICKFCGSEIDDDVIFCPRCGKDQSEPAEEKKKPKTWKIVLAVVGGLALLAVLVFAVLYGLGIDLGPRENDVFYRDSYTVKDAVAEKKADIVVATVGDQVLTNGELQAHYWMGVFDFLDYYSYYLTYMGLDLDAPLDEQIYDEATGMTYQQMFLKNALETWRRYASLVQMSQESNFQLNAEQKEYLDTFGSYMQKLAEENKYTDVEEFIDKEMFPGSSLKAYYEYNRVSYIALAYYDTIYEGLMPTKAEIEAYYEEHKADFEQNKITKESGDYYDVRHILVAIEGGTKDEDGNTVYSDAEWEACRAKAQKMLDDFLAGEATEEAFAELAINNSADPGSAESGGLYEKLTKDTAFIEGFKNWYLEEGRKPGDTGLVKNTESSVQGYHIMYFSGSTPIWEYETQSTVLSENTSKVLEDAQNKWPMDVDYKKIVLGYIDLTEE